VSKREKGSFEFAVKEYSTRRHSTAEPNQKEAEDRGWRIEDSESGRAEVRH
jgi:hypothetical protein